MYFVLLTGSLRANSNFESSCACIENSLSLVVTCTVTGEGTTVWEGSALDCPQSDDIITLIHREFNNVSEKPPVTCNNGAILASAIGVDGINYTSQLNVSVTKNSLNLLLDNKTLKCLYERQNQLKMIESTVIGSLTLISNCKRKFDCNNN